MIVLIFSMLFGIIKLIIPIAIIFLIYIIVLVIKYFVIDADSDIDNNK